MSRFGKDIAAYAGKGLKVLPLNGKSPSGKEVSGWPKRDFDTQQVVSILNTYAQPAIGVQMGPASGLIDFEYDSEAQRQQIVKLLEGYEYLLDICPAFTSTNGGHYLFRYDERLEATNAGNLYIPCDNGEKLIVRIGAAGKGSQSAFPPSPGKTWLPDRSILEGAAPALPDDVIERLLQFKRPPQFEIADDPDTEATPAQVEHCRTELEKLPDSIAGAGGHDALLQATCEIRRHHIYHDQLKELQHWYNENKCRPCWDEDELAHKREEAKKFVPSAEAEFDAVAVVGDVSKVVHAAERRIKVLRSAELASSNYENRFMIERVLVEKQPLVLVAKSKVGKTTLAVASAVSVATGKPFLGYEQFTVLEAQPTLVMSGESGLATLKETGHRIAKSYGLSLGELDNLFWSEQLPQFDSRALLGELNAYISELGIKLLIVDPVYLAMPGADAHNVIVMGRLLRNIGEICQEAGVTLVLVHHLKKTTNGSPSLNDIAWSGFSEFARQWWILERRSRFAHGIHDLKLSVGGSAGHHGEWFVQIDEGQPDHILTHRKWEVTVMPVCDEIDTNERTETTERANRIVAVLGASDAPLAKSTLMRLAKMNYATGCEILKELVASETVRQEGDKYALAQAPEIEF